MFKHTILACLWKIVRHILSVLSVYVHAYFIVFSALKSHARLDSREGKESPIPKYEIWWGEVSGTKLYYTKNRGVIESTLWGIYFLENRYFIIIN